MVARIALRCLGLLAVGSTIAQAQVFELKQVAVPDAHSLRSLYAFFVYSQGDAPAHSQEAASVAFRGFEGVAANHAPTEGSVQVSLVRYEDFWDLIPKRFCSVSSDVTSGRSKAEAQLLLETPPGTPYEAAGVYPHTVPFATGSGEAQSKAAAVKSDVTKSGVYLLVVSNCGAEVDAAVSGTVVVRSSYGFLPGNDYHKKPLYGTLLLIRASLLVVWSVLLLRWWKSLNQFQGYIFFAILAGVLEALLWYIFLNGFNSTGIRGGFVFPAAMLFRVVRALTSYALLLVAALGWGVTKEYWEPSDVFKIQVIGVCYFVCAFASESIVQYRQSDGIALRYVIVAQLPASLTTGVIFYWIFSSFSNVLQTLRDQGRSDKVRLFVRFGIVLLAALGADLLLMLFQVFDFGADITRTWTRQWLLTDGVSQAQFLLVLLAMMCLWAPGGPEDGYLGAQPGKIADREAGEGLGDPAATWADEDADLLGGGEQGAGPPAAAGPEVIGAVALDSRDGEAPLGGAE